MLVQLLGGEMLAHTVLILEQGGCHTRRVVAHQVTIRSGAGGNRQQCATSHATIKVPQAAVRGGFWHTRGGRSHAGGVCTCLHIRSAARPAAGCAVAEWLY